MYYIVWNIGISGTFCVIGTAANIACLVVFCKYRNLAGSLLPLLRALATADLWHLFLFSMLIVWPNLAFTCCGGEKIWPVVVYSYIYVWPIVGIFASMSIWLVLLISVHRYVAVIHPLRHAQFSSPRNIHLHLAVVCVAAVVFEVTRFFEIIAVEVFDEKTNTTSLDWGYSDLFYDPYYQLIYKNIILLTLRLYLPIVVISYTSVRIILSMQKRNKVHALKPSRGKEREMKITKTMLAIMVTFIVTQLPLCFYPLARLILPDEKKTLCSAYSLYALTADSLSLINFCANFFIYLVAWQSFRDRLLATCTCCRCCSCCAKKKSGEGKNENSLSMTVQATTSVTQRENI